MSDSSSVLSKTDQVEVEIEKIVDGGHGLGRHDGLPIFVPRSAPGDRLRVTVTERRPNYARAEILEILAPGEGRREAPCPFFESCGGCDLQHLEDSLQTDLKVEAARETLARLGGVELPERQRVVRGDSWAYRLRTQLQVQPGDERSLVGYHARGTRDLVSIDRCPVLVPQLERQLGTLPRNLAGESLRRLDLLAWGDRLSAAPPVAGMSGSQVTIEVGEFRYQLDARVFFQGHAGLLDELIEAVSEDDEGKSAVDLYSGVGFFTLPLAKRYERVTAVEGDRVAVRYARKNARLNQLSNIDFVSTAVESWIPRLPDGLDRVVLDPPRVGLTPRVRVRLLEGKPKRVTYVSCHTAALARDLKILQRVFELHGLVFLDLFPQTGHLEVVAQLRRRP